jgi:hypothetical protein
MQIFRPSICSLLGLPILLLGCSSQSSAADIKKELTTVKSWTATAYMVGDAWKRGAIPTPYAQQTLQKSQEELHKSEKTLIKKSVDQKLIGYLHDIDKTLSQMSNTVEQKDHTNLDQQMQQLSLEQQEITTFADTIGE